MFSLEHPLCSNVYQGPLLWKKNGLHRRHLRATLAIISSFHDNCPKSLLADSKSSKSTQGKFWKLGVTPMYDTMDPCKVRHNGANPKLIGGNHNAL